MRICLNGEERELHEDATLAALLETLELKSRKIAVEHNLAIVPRSLYAETRLSDGDMIEIVRFIGGG